MTQTIEQLIERLNAVREGMEAGLDDWPTASQIWEYREAVKTIKQLTARVLELEEENARLNGVIESNIDDGIDKIMAMSDEQVSALAGFEGSNPEDKATIARQCMDIAMLRVDLAAGQAYAEQLREALNAWIGIASNCSIESGVCGCGEEMKNHSSPMTCGHSPVDMADYVVHSAIQTTNKALALPHPTSALDAYVAEKVKEALSTIKESEGK